MSEIEVVEVEADLEDLMPLFMETRQKDLADLAAGLAAGNFTALRLTGHSMKGAGGSYGFDRVSEMGALIEEAALAGDAASIKVQMETLRGYLQRIQIKYV